MMSKQYKEILEYLQNSHSGARMMGDTELELRIARAIMAFEADVYEDIFADGLIEKEIEKEMSATIHYKVKQEIIKTNSDKIRNMTDEEMAAFIEKHFCHGYGRELILKWLKEKADAEI